ncbi:Uncharacterized protein APZ42_002257, partial [Daphnia magna]
SYTARETIFVSIALCLNCPHSPLLSLRRLSRPFEDNFKLSFGCLKDNLRSSFLFLKDIFWTS